MGSNPGIATGTQIKADLELKLQAMPPSHETSIAVAQIAAAAKKLRLRMLMPQKKRKHSVMKRSRRS
jgi:hypothetical protein